MEIPRPTREFFESDPLAADIRNLTLDGIAGCLHSLLGREGWTGKIMDATAGLRERGVTPGMHLIESDDPEVIDREQQELMTTPKKAAEFVGGMLLRYLYEADGALEMPLPTTPEGQETVARMLAEGEMPPNIQLATIDMSSLTLMEHMLDRQPDELREQP